MSNDHIKRMMDLLGFTEGEREPAPLTITQVFPINKQVVPTDPHTIHVDKWDKRKASEILPGSGLPDCITEVPMADFYGLAFKPDPKLTDGCIDARRQEFVKELLETPEYKSLHTYTMLNVFNAETAAIDFAKSFAKLLEADKKRESRYCKGGKPAPSKANQELAREMALGKAVGEALKEAKADVDEAEAIAQALGIGSQTGGEVSQVKSEEIAETFKKVRGSMFLKAIVDSAGKFIRDAQAKQFNKTSHGYDDMVGVEWSGDLARLLPSELVKLAIPELELDLMRRFVEKQLMSRQYKGMEPENKGPFILCMDESGSMSGQRIINAKATALAMAWVARHQRRWLGLVGFSGATDGHFLAMPPTNWDDAKLLIWLEHFYSHGTDAQVPLVNLPNVYWKEMQCPRGKTDMILISDGDICISPEMKAGFLEWKKKEQVKCIALLLDTREQGDFGDVSDEIYFMNGLELHEGGIQRILGM